MSRVLIFETDHAFAVELRTELTNLGCTVQVFKEGNTGLLAASTHPPDIILLSVELPRVNGFSICNKIKKDATLSTVPLIIMSTHSSPETFEQHQRLPTRAEAYVHKPVPFTDLLIVIQQFITIGGASAGGFEIEDEATSQVSEADLEILEEVIDDPSSDYDDTFNTVQHNVVEQAVDPQRLRQDSFTNIEIPVVDDLSAVTQEAPATQQRGDGSAPVAPFVPEYALGDDDDGDFEQTQVASRDMVAEAAAMVGVAMPGVRAPPDSAVPLTPSQVGQLRDDAAGGKRALQHALRQLSEAKMAAAEVGRFRQENQQLRQDLEVAHAQLSSAADGSQTSERGMLDLKEQIQTRDKEVVTLREQASAKDREAIEARDATLAAERVSADLKQALGHVETQHAEAQKRVEAMEADKTLADKRANDFKVGARKIADQLNDRTRALQEARDQHERQFDVLRKGQQKKLDEQAATARSEVSAAEAAHQEQLARLKEAHDQTKVALAQQQSAAQHEQQAHAEQKEAAAEQLKQANEQLQQTNEQLQQAAQDAQTHHEQLQQANEQQQQAAQDAQTHHEQAQAHLDEEKAKATQSLSDANKTQAEKVKELTESITALKGDLEAAAEAHVQAISALREELGNTHQASTKKALKQAREQARTEARAEALEEAASKHDAILDGAQTNHASALSELRDEHTKAVADALADLESEQAEALQQSGYETQEKLLQKEESFKSIKEGLDRDLAAAQKDTAALREQIAKLEADESVSELRTALANEQEQSLQLDEQVTNLQAESDDFRAQLDSLGEQVLEVDTQLATEKAKLDKVRARWGEDRKALVQAKEALASIVSQLTAAAAQELDG
jgi:DNA-binding response OmpR family regulator/chromosome segregation ATPase